MNKVIKFHKPSSPAFDPGEVWVSANGAKVVIDKVCPWPGSTEKWSYTVHYTQSDGTPSKKDAWNFQVRYTHQADLAAANLMNRVKYEATDEGNTPD